MIKSFFCNITNKKSYKDTFLYGFASLLVLLLSGFAYVVLIADTMLKNILLLLFLRDFYRISSGF